MDNRRLAAGAATYQSYWQSPGTWRPEAWRLPLAVLVDRRLAGVQELEAPEFASLRTCRHLFGVPVAATKEEETCG